MGRASGDMARSRDDHLWALAQAERAALSEDLSGLNAEQWRHSTLCGQWDVEEVVAHLTAAASLNQWRWVRSMLGARFRVDVHNQRRLVEHRGSTPAETLDRFHAIIGSTTAPSGHPGLPWRGRRARPRHPSAAGNAADTRRRRADARG